MAEKVELEIRIGIDGQIRVETHGLHGQDCVTETKDLLPALGRVLRREKTRDFYLQGTQKTNVTRTR